MSLGAPVLEPWIRRWGDDPHSWNFENDDDLDDGGNSSDCSGMPGRNLVGGVLLRWLSSSPGSTVADASAVFNLPEAFVLDAMRADLFDPADLGEAVQTWSLCVGGDVPIAMASAVFGIPHSAVMTVVCDHPFMFLDWCSGTMCFGHDGL